MYKKIVILVVFLLIQTQSNAGLKEAYDAYDSKRFEEAYTEFKSLAEIGHKVGQYNLGHMYLEGKGVKQDLIKAYAWIKFSENKEREYQEILGNISAYLNQDRLSRANALLETLQDKYSKESLKASLEPILVKEEDLKEPKKQRYAKPVKQRRPVYPEEAAYKGVDGWVIFEFKVNEDGRPVDIRVDDSYPLACLKKTL